MPLVQLGRDVVDYELDGQGPGLVLVHGAGGDATKAFGGFVPLVSEQYTVIRPNLSGSGDTTDGGGELTVELLAEQVITATVDAAPGPVDLFGFSLGAAVAATVAATRPDLVNRLILAGGAARTTGPRDRFNFTFWRDLLATDFSLFERFALIQGFSPAVLNAFGHDGLAGSLGATWPQGLARQVALGARVDICALLPRVEAPTLVIGFGADQMATMEGSRELQAGIRGSRLVEIPGAGHMDWFAQPDMVVNPTLEFLNAGASRGSQSFANRPSRV